MNSKVNCGIMFFVGTVLGACGGYYFAKKKYEMIANEEIESVKESFNETNEDLNRKLNKLSDEMAEQLVANKGDSPMDYVNKNMSEEPEDNDIPEEEIINDGEIENLFDRYGTQKKQAEKDTNKSVGTAVSSEPIYVITPEEYGELDNYNLVSLTLTKDGYLLDDQNEIIDDPIGAIGEDSLSFMGEYEDDSVHVRNEIRQCDYEILQDERSLSDILGN